MPDLTISVWNRQLSTTLGALRIPVPEGKLSHRVGWHSAAVTALAFSPDGMMIASGCSDGRVRLWDTATGSIISVSAGHTGEIKSIAFSPDGKLLVSGSADYTSRVWEVATGKAVATLNGHLSWVRAVAVNPDGMTVATGSSDTSIRLWDLKSGAELNFMSQYSYVTALAFSPDGRRLAASLWGGGRHTQGHGNDQPADDL